MDRPLAEIIGAVLHELRRSGPLGLRVDELQGRIDSPLVASAVSTLAEEGRVVVRGDLVRRSAAELTIEELRAALASAEARLAAALEPARPHAELGKRLYALFESLRDDRVESTGTTCQDAFACGLHAGAWIASYGGATVPPLRVVRVAVGDTTIRCAVLGAHQNLWMLCSPATGLFAVNRLGVAAGGESRVIDEDLARLRAARAEG